MSIRTGIYVRVSTDDQKENGFSIDSQLRMLKEYCDKNNYDIIDIYNDIIINEMEMFILKEKIIKETLNLLNTKTFDKITIKDITDNLNISRQAFYYHFNDLYEVVETICTNSYKMVTNTYTDLEDWKFVYLYILRLIYNHKDVVSNIYKTIEREYVDNFLYNSLFPYVENVIIKQSKNLNVEKKDIDFISKYFTLSFIAITSDWIKNGMKEKPELLVRNVYLIINNDFKKALNNFEKNNKKVDILI